MSSWSKEPWTTDAEHWREVCDISLYDAGDVFVANVGEAAPCVVSDCGEANGERIVQCVNACAGIPDPARAIALAREALAEVEFWAHRGDYIPHDTLSKARAALAAIGEQR